MKHGPTIAEYTEAAVAYSVTDNSLYKCISAANEIRDTRILSIIEEWTKPQTIRLRAGEMTAQEMRTVQAVMRGLLEAVKEAQG